MDNYKAYIFDNDKTASKRIMLASNYAGRAINITQTTAAHAMSYKITSMYGIPHGHAVAICLPYLWSFMIENNQHCIDIRGKDYLLDIFNNISKSMGSETPDAAVEKFSALINDLGIKKPENVKFSDIKILVDSVNTTRLSNNPVSLSSQNLYDTYVSILEMGDMQDEA